MLVLIDGYNLLFHLLSSGENLKEEREKLIVFLSQRLSQFSFKSIVVFDSHYRPGEASKAYLRSLEIIFTDERETADEAILELIKREKSPKNCLVVTSDKRLAWRAKACLAKTESVHSFLKKISRPRKAIPKNEKKEPLFFSLKKEPEPSKKSDEEALFERYLKVFEESYKELEIKTPSKPQRKIPEGKIKRKREIKKMSGEINESDFDRWLREFQKKINGA